MSDLGVSHFHRNFQCSVVYTGQNFQDLFMYWFCVWKVLVDINKGKSQNKSKQKSDQNLVLFMAKGAFENLFS